MGGDGGALRAQSARRYLERIAGNGAASQVTQAPLSTYERSMQYPVLTDLMVQPGSPIASPRRQRRTSHTGSAIPMGMAEARRVSLASKKDAQLSDGHEHHQHQHQHHRHHLHVHHSLRHHDVGDGTEFTLAMRAATTIGRAWRKRTRGPELDRKNFVERLILEDDVCLGITVTSAICLSDPRH